MMRHKINLKFNIYFNSSWGQKLYIVGSIAELGKWNPDLACPMNCQSNGLWTLEIEIAKEGIECFEYKYLVKTENKTLNEEWHKNHFYEIENGYSQIELIDRWYNRPPNLPFYSTAFSKSLFVNPQEEKYKKLACKNKIIFQVYAPLIQGDQTLALLGNNEYLGQWNIDKALTFYKHKSSCWCIELDAHKMNAANEYKLLIVNKKDKSLVRWETYDNRTIYINIGNTEKNVAVYELQFNQDNTNWKCAGLAIPVFSLRSKNSFGIGDFADLKLMVDWAAKTNQKVLQILPINDTTMTHTWGDSYPYNAISIYALHPLYLSLQKMGSLHNQQRKYFYLQAQKDLNQLKIADYEKVDHIKWMFFKEIFEQNGSSDCATKEYKAFFEHNKEWLLPYAAYSFLREHFQTCDYKQWGKFACYNKELIQKICSPKSGIFSQEHYPQIQMYFYIQYHLHKQLSETRDHAHKNNIVLKGDIPIGVSKTSIEAWTDPRYFNMQVSVGAPPDDFSVFGQNWGFPSYNWDVMEKDNYAWWKKRFGKMSDYFDAYRIDHILGFFRIWEIDAKSVQGLQAWFNPALPLSRDEIELKGLTFDKDELTPKINNCALYELFGGQRDEVAFKFLDEINVNTYILKEKYNTQQKINAEIDKDSKDSEDSKNNNVKQGLFTISNECLFIEDPVQRGKYHPRIAAFQTFIYRELSQEEKSAFDQIYNDYFYQRHEQYWKEMGYKHLTPLLASNDMLACGEDLGMIPDSVPEVMQELQVLSLEIERMPKQANVEFADLTQIPYLSVCTTSTHDMATIRIWWEEDKEKTQRYFNKVLGMQGEAPQTCTEDLCEKIILRHLSSPAMLTILPLQDWLSIDEHIRRENAEMERINIPANPHHYWSYRMHINIEDLIENEKLNLKIKNLIIESKRI